MEIKTSTAVFYLVLIVLTILVIVYIIKRRNRQKPDVYTQVQKTTQTMLAEPTPNMKNTYYIDFDVFYSASAKHIHIIHDRISPLIKLKMSTGQLIIDYLDDSPKNRYVYDTRQNKLKDVTEYFINAPLIENFTHPVDAAEAEDESEEKDSCLCPPPPPPGDSSGNKGTNAASQAKVMRIRTPSVSFQRNNKIEIRQNLRMIDVYLNGQLLHTGMLEHVPYLYPGKGALLPEDAGRYIHINKFTFENKLDE